MKIFIYISDFIVYLFVQVQWLFPQFNTTKNNITKIAIIGTANIARKNIRAIMLADNIRCSLIASRCDKRALKFSKENNVPRSVGNYSLALQDNDIDAFYLPTPTCTHKRWLEEICRTDKLGVLCEKPCAINSLELLEILKLFIKHNKVFMDGVMFMHHPRLKEMKIKISS